MRQEMHEGDLLQRPSSRLVVKKSLAREVDIGGGFGGEGGWWRRETAWKRVVFEGFKVRE